MTTTDLAARARHGLSPLWNSILSGLILAGIVAVVTLLWIGERATADARAAAAAADSARAVQIAALQTQVAEVQKALSGVPELGQRVMRLETNQSELMRRQAADEAWREHFTERGGRLPR